MNNVKWTMLANCSIWIASSIAITVAVCTTRNPKCLWALLIPAMSGYCYKYRN